jgi:hypothetical protein
MVVGVVMIILVGVFFFRRDVPATAAPAQPSATIIRPTTPPPVPVPSSSPAGAPGAQQASVEDVV